MTDRESEYLWAVLSLSPERKAAEMLELRRAFLGLEQRLAPPAAAEREALRQWARDDLAEIRDAFWTLDERALERRLADSPGWRLPDFSLPLARLRRVAGVGARLDDLVRDRRVAKSLAEALKNIVVADSREATFLRDLHLAGLDNRRRRRSWHLSASRLEAAHPEVFALEDTWLHSIQTWRPPANRAASAARRFLTHPANAITVMAAILGALAAVVRWLL